VILHVAQLGEALAAHGADVRFLSRVGQPVNVHILAGIKPLGADDALVGSLPRVAPHVPFESFGAGEAALAQGAPEGLLPRVGAGVPAELRRLEEAHAAVGAAVRLLRLLLVRLLVRLAVARLGEAFAADRAGVGPLPGVYAPVAVELIQLTERLHAVRTLVGLLGLLGVNASVPLELGRPVEHLPAVGAGVLVRPAVAILVPEQLLLMRKSLLAVLTLVQGLGLPRVHRSMPLQLRRPVEGLAANGARVPLVRRATLGLFLAIGTRFRDLPCVVFSGT